jgi:hypothetical protein
VGWERLNVYIRADSNPRELSPARLLRGKLSQRSLPLQKPAGIPSPIKREKNPIFLDRSRFFFHFAGEPTEHHLLVWGQGREGQKPSTFFFSTPFFPGNN